MHPWLPAALVACVSASLQGQPAGYNAPDSATVARTAFSVAARRLRSNDLVGARAELDRAARAWPLQPTYVWNSAVLAARSGDTTAVLRQLGAYAMLGLGQDLAADTTWRLYRTHPAFKKLEQQHQANRTPIHASARFVTIDDSTFWAEDVDYDSLTERFYVSSIRHRTIAEISRNGHVRELLARHQPGIGAMTAVRVDMSRRVLWAATTGMPHAEGYAPSDSRMAALLRIRLEDGSIEQRYNVSGSGPHALGDIEVTRDGDVFVSDSWGAALYVLKNGSDTLSRIAHPLLRSPQGITASPHEPVLYIADYSHGIIRFEIASGTFTWMGSADGVTPLGIDGLSWHDGALVGIQNGFPPGRVVLYRLTENRLALRDARIIDQQPDLADEPTNGVMVGNRFVYIANSQWEKYDAQGARRRGVRLMPTVLLALPMPPG